MTVTATESLATKVPLADRVVGSEPVQTVSARDLHKFLESRRDFSTWIKDRLEGFIENADFVVSRSASSSPNLGNGRFHGADRVEYHLTLDTAKHLAMIERTTKGHEARQYFIELEKAARKLWDARTASSIFLLDVPSEWQKRFPDEFFRHVHRIYGIQFERPGKSPQFLGRFINRFVYNHILDGLSDELKAKRRSFSGGSHDQLLKLHQFLEENAAKALDTHIQRVIGLLMASDDDGQFKSAFDRMFENSKQMLLRLVPGTRRITQPRRRPA